LCFDVFAEVEAVQPLIAVQRPAQDIAQGHHLSPLAHVTGDAVGKVERKPAEASVGLRNMCFV
jgi:hypothetical protein